MLGTNSFGLPIHFDRNAFEADGIVLLNRIKPHTSFTGRYESGLLKMLTVGLGKRQGAAQVHKLGLPGLRRLLPEVGAFLLEQTPVVLGVAILENCAGTHRPDRRRRARGPAGGRAAAARRSARPDGPAAVRPDRRAGRGRAGQELQRDRARPQRDRPPARRDDARPAPTRSSPDWPCSTCRSRPAATRLGIGLADLTTERLVRGIDPTPMRVNSLTSNFLTRARVPLALPTDRDVIAACLDTCWRIDAGEARMVLIPNTLELTSFWVTPPLAAEVEAHPELELRDRVPCHSVRSSRATSSRSDCSPRASEPGGSGDDQLNRGGPIPGGRL